VNVYKGDIQPANDVIFVFGSNPEGRHGAGAAKVARERFGAIYGVGEGLQGNSYAIPTKDLRIKGTRSIHPQKIQESIERFYDVAKSNPDKKFMVAYRNGMHEKSLNGYTGLEMLLMFMNAGEFPNNVYFSSEWKSMYDELMLLEEK